ncbi:efflux RND transporter permease subunit [Pectobacterium parvum]|uniref:Efflux RND transporter permease subunit n=1 Tax=Pectobacterium parvum TaxID=2778550 RepID=A0AAP9LEG8_9GAMM|nr:MULTISPECIES: efflux RND transporter permease subunit [Pectobacterium]QHQ26281.1 multidrug transporter subunit MdtC [Pectobacterium parvum]UFK40802.1 efflux RND transporter permease subunit [Pectobacterium parvum]GKW40898.1 multidrug resistance protein MdtC [Pectobacterium carotovorum subsp. carotovorum]
MRLLTRLCIRRPVATLLLMISISVVGLIGFRLLPVAPLPQVDLPTIIVTAALPGASPDTMAATVATPLERMLGQIAGITEMTSSNSPGTTMIVLQFDISRNIDGAARDVQAAIDAAQSLLPSGMPTLPAWRKINPADVPVLVIAVTSDRLSRPELYQLVSGQMQQRISQLPGVGTADILGSSAPAIRIDLNLQRVTNLGLSLETVRRAVKNATSARAEGELEDQGSRLIIEGQTQADSVPLYRSLIVSWRNGHAVRLGDIATIVEGVEDNNNVGFYNQSPAVMLSISRQADANMLDVITGVKQRLPSLKAGLPDSVSLNIVVDRADYVRSSLHEAELTLLLSILLVIVVIYYFLRDVRALFIASMTLPIALLGSFAVMWGMGYSLNNLSLMALIISTGFIVDDAIVVLENVSRHTAKKGAIRAALVGTQEVGFTLVAMTASLIAILLPLLLLDNLMGRVFREFAVTLTATLIISLFVSLTLTPMLCARLLRNSPSLAAENPELGGQRLLTACHSALQWTLAHRRLTLGSLIVMIILNIALYRAVDKGFFPHQDTGLLKGVVQVEDNASFTVLKQKLLDSVQEIRQDPAVESVVTASNNGLYVNRTSATIYILLKPTSQRTDSALAVAERLNQSMSKRVGVKVLLRPAEDLHIGARNANAAWQYTLTADSSDRLREWEAKMKARLNKLPQLRDVDSDLQTGGIKAMFNVDRDRASQLGISMSDINNLFNNLFSQRQIGTFYHDDNLYHVVMNMDEASLANPRLLQDLFVINTVGEAVPISALAQLVYTPASVTVAHQGGIAAATLSFNLQPGVSLEQAEQLIGQQEVASGLPDTVHAALQGSARAASKFTMTIPLLIFSALFILYVVMGILYESYIHPLTILSTLPSAGIGAQLLMLLTQTPLTIVSLIGILLLAGIVLKNGIMMIDVALTAQDRGAPPLEAITHACRVRFRPIMMTSLAAFLGALPLALNYGGDAALRRPLGLAIAGGLALSQILTLFTTPVVWLYFDRFRRRNGRNAPKDKDAASSQ